MTLPGSLSSKQEEFATPEKFWTRLTSDFRPINEQFPHETGRRTCCRKQQSVNLGSKTRPDCANWQAEIAQLSDRQESVTICAYERAIPEKNANKTKKFANYVSCTS